MIQERYHNEQDAIDRAIELSKKVKGRVNVVHSPHPTDDGEDDPTFYVEHDFCNLIRIWEKHLGTFLNGVRT